MKSDRVNHRRPREPVDSMKTFRRLGKLSEESSKGYPLGKPPTGSIESDVGEFIRRFFGEPPGIECDIGLVIYKSMSAKSKATWLTEDENHDDSCLTMVCRRIQLCLN